MQANFHSKRKLPQSRVPLMMIPTIHHYAVWVLQQKALEYSPTIYLTIPSSVLTWAQKMCIIRTIRIAGWLQYVWGTRAQKMVWYKLLHLKFSGMAPSGSGACAFCVPKTKGDSHLSLLSASLSRLRKGFPWHEKRWFLVKCTTGEHKTVINLLIGIRKIFHCWNFDKNSLFIS